MTDSPTREAQTPELTLQALKAAIRQSPVPSAAERKHKLTELKKQLSRYQDVFADAASSDFGGRPAFESRLIETVGTTWVVDHARRNVAKWMKPEGRWPQMLFSGPNRLHVTYQPKGVVGIIAPWNMPLYLSLGPLAADAVLRTESSARYLSTQRRGRHHRPLEYAVIPFARSAGRCTGCR